MEPVKRQIIALDVMGSDQGVAEIIDGGLAAAREWGDRLQVLLVGRQDAIEAVLAERSDCPDNVAVQHAPNEVPMGMSASEAVRLRDSSVRVGLRLVRQREAHAFVSPGNTGAVMGTSLLRLGRIEGVARPAIATLFPTSTGKHTLVLDAGANADCKPIHLSQFAIMGSTYYEVKFREEAPRVGLLSIGEERSKGNELIFNARRLLQKSKINFVGNIEGRDILSGTIDVAVTDGFTGNILLKLAESIQPMLVKTIQRQIQTNLFSRVGAMLLLPFLRRVRDRFDYAESGGAPLLGVNGVVIICHGSSNARAIYNGVGVAREMVSRGLLDRLRHELVTNHFGNSNGSGSKSQDSGNGVFPAASADDQH